MTHVKLALVRRQVWPTGEQSLHVLTDLTPHSRKLEFSAHHSPLDHHQGLQEACAGAGIGDDLAQSLLSRSIDEEVKERLKGETEAALQR